jgi:hypothetical protein
MKRLAQDLGIQLVSYREMVGLQAARVSQEEG